MVDVGRVLPWEVQQADTSQTTSMSGQNKNESSSDEASMGEGSLFGNYIGLKVFFCSI